VYIHSFLPETALVVQQIHRQPADAPQVHQMSEIPARLNKLARLNAAQAGLGTPIATTSHRDNVTPKARFGPAGCEPCAQFWNSGVEFWDSSLRGRLRCLGISGDRLVPTSGSVPLVGGD
jgi:hypothetical protein